MLHKNKYAQVVRITAKSLANPAVTSTLYLSTKYFGAYQLDPTLSFQIYPLIEREVTLRYGGIGYDSYYTSQSFPIAISIYAKNPISEVGVDFDTFRKNYSLQGATVEIWQYNYRHFETEIFETGKTLRDTLEITDASYDRNRGIVDLTCVSRFFNDVELGFRCTQEDFVGLADEYEGRFAPIIFSDSAALYDSNYADHGRELVAVDAIPILSETNIGASGTRFHTNYLLGAGANTAIQPYGVGKVWARNTNNAFNPSEWLEMALPSGGRASRELFNTDLANWIAGTNQDLSLVSGTGFGVVDAPVNHTAYRNIDGEQVGCVLTHVAVGYKCFGTYSADLGSIVVDVTFGAVQADSLQFSPVGSTIARGRVDLSSLEWSSVGKVSVIALDNPITLGPNDVVFASAKYENTRDAVNYISLLGQVGGASTGYTRYFLNQSGGKFSWARQNDRRVAIELLTLGSVSGVTFATSPFNYMAYDVGSINTYISVAPDNQVLPNFADKIKLKCGLLGLSSPFGLGFTNSATSIQITSPAQIIKLCLSPSYSAGLLRQIQLEGSVELEDPMLAGGPAIKLGKDWNMSFALYNESLKDLIREICKHSRLIITKTRDNKLRLLYPEYKSVPDFTLSYDLLGESLRIVSVEENPYSQVINSFELEFNADNINVLLTPDALKQLRKKDKYLGKVVLTSTVDSTGLIPVARSRCAESVALYGQRKCELTETPFYQGVSKVANLVNYLALRYSKLQSRLVIEVPNTSANQSIELLSYVQVEHPKLNDTSGTSEEVTIFEDFATCETEFENVKGYPTSHGIFYGQVIQIDEVNGVMRLHLETVSPF